MSVKRRIKGLEGVRENKPSLNVMVLIRYPDGRYYDTGAECYRTLEEIEKINPETIVMLPDNGREKQPE